MVLNVDSDAAYLVHPKARSRAGGQIFDHDEINDQQVKYFDLRIIC